MNVSGNIVHRVYTIQELRSWLVDNQPNGLSEYAIAPTRALTLINNPCAKDEDPVLVVTFDGDRPIGYSAVFADEYLKGNTIGRFFWGTTEWIEPEYRGKGIAGKMMRTLKDAVGIERYIGLESSIASVKLDQKQGASIEIYDKVKFQLAANDSLKGYLLTKRVACNNARQQRMLTDYAFQNEYIRFVDVETYRFIEAHSDNGLFLRQRDMLNWILRYPFGQGCTMLNRVKNDTIFSSYVDSSEYNVVKVFKGERLIGLYLLRKTGMALAVVYLYYAEEYKECIFTSIVDHIITLKPKQVLLENKGLLTYIQQRLYFPKIEEENVSLSLPEVKGEFAMQLGDGDSFA